MRIPFKKINQSHLANVNTYNLLINSEEYFIGSSTCSQYIDRITFKNLSYKLVRKHLRLCLGFINFALIFAQMGVI